METIQLGQPFTKGGKIHLLKVGAGCHKMSGAQKKYTKYTVVASMSMWYSQVGRFLGVFKHKNLVTVTYYCT